MTPIPKDPPRKSDTISVRVFIACASSLIVVAIISVVGRLSNVSLIKLLGGVTKTEFEERVKTLIPSGAIVRIGHEQTSLYLAVPIDHKGDAPPLLFGDEYNAKTERWKLDFAPK